MVYIDGPIIGTATNTEPLTLRVPKSVGHFVVYFETGSDSGSASVAILCVPWGGTKQQVACPPVDLKPNAMEPCKIDRIQAESFTFIPSGLSDGTVLKVIMQPIVE